MDRDRDSTDTDSADADSGPPLIRAKWKHDDQLAEVISELVAEATDLEPTELSPLSESVNPEALEALVSGAASPNGRIHVAFTHAGVDVTVGSEGKIEARTDGAKSRGPPGPNTDEELNERLKRVLNGAARNGISVTGGWVVRNGPELPDLDIHITHVTKPGGGSTSGRTEHRTP